MFRLYCAITASSEMTATLPVLVEVSMPRMNMIIP